MLNQRLPTAKHPRRHSLRLNLDTEEERAIRAAAYREDRTVSSYIRHHIVALAGKANREVTDELR